VKLKVFICLNTWLRGVPDEHRAANGCKQFFIVCKTYSNKRLGQILNTSVATLTKFGCRETDSPTFTQQADDIE